MTQPVEQNLTCYKGQTYSQNLYFTVDGEVLPLEGLTPKSQIRQYENSPILIAEFVCSIDTNTGRLNLWLSNETTGKLKQGEYVWDLKMIDETGDVHYWLRGKFTVNGRVTV